MQLFEILEEYLAECFLDSVKERIKSKLNNAKLRKALREQMERHRKIFETIPCTSEFDFQTLSEYITDEIPDSISKQIFSVQPTDRKKAREKLVTLSIDNAKAHTDEAKKYVAEMINQCFQIIDGFYTDQIDMKDFILASVTVDNINQHMDETRDEILKAIEEIKTLFQNKVEDERKKEITSFDIVFKELYYELRDSSPETAEIVKAAGTFITQVINELGEDKLKKNERRNIEVGVLSTVDRIINEGEISLQEMIETANEDFYKKDKNTVAFSIFSAFFSELFLTITKSPLEHADMIQYKTNADICKGLNEFTKHVSFQTNPVKMDHDRRCLNICLSCDEANAHKAAALFVNEFERALSGLEDIFDYLGIQLYYIRATIMPSGKDNVANYNFEAYTPTLLPLLSGGHLYKTPLVFLRELVQNAIDTISVRRELDGAKSTDIVIKIRLDEELRIQSLSIQDHGTGMGKNEIERYLTSIGRSYYTASDYKYLNLPYHPISRFGIGFLSCFLVSKEIVIKTHSRFDGGNYHLTIPNIEGCFFIESNREEYDGTTIELNIDDIGWVELLEYAGKCFLDLPYNLFFQWDKAEMFSMETDWKLHTPNTDLAEFAHKQAQKPPTPFAIMGNEVIVLRQKARTFKADWWNRYIRHSYDVGLGSEAPFDSSLQIAAHHLRKPGERFALFLSFEHDGDVKYSAKMEEPYGMIIKDLPHAGVIIRSGDNGQRPYSGKLRILNAGILVDDGDLEFLCGSNMRVYNNDQEAAHNDVIINFPPCWVELNVSREKIIKLSSSVDKRKVLKGIASATLEGMKRYSNSDVPLVNMQETANFIINVCRENNDDDGKQLLTKLKNEKFLLQISAKEDGIHYDIIADHDETINMQTWFAENLKVIRNMVSKANVRNDFFEEIERLLGRKKIVNIDEINRDLKNLYQENNLALKAFAAYLCFFPEERVDNYSKKAGQARLTLEWQLMKKHTMAEFTADKLHWVVGYGKIDELMVNICKE